MTRLSKGEIMKRPEAEEAADMGNVKNRMMICEARIDSRDFRRRCDGSLVYSPTGIRHCAAPHTESDGCAHTNGYCEQYKCIPFIPEEHPHDQAQMVVPEFLLPYSTMEEMLRNSSGTIELHRDTDGYWAATKNIISSKYIDPRQALFFVWEETMRPRDQGRS